MAPRAAAAAPAAGDAAPAGGPEKQASTAWWCRSPEEVARELRVDVAVGLSEDEARARLARYGPNELAKEAGKPLWKLILEQFDDSLVKVRLFFFLLFGVGAVVGSRFVAAGPLRLTAEGALPPTYLACRRAPLSR